MDIAKKLNLIRAKHLQRRTRLDDDGRWVTTEHDHKIHINGEGEIDKGNPHVLKAIKAGQARSKRLEDVKPGDIFWSRGQRWKKTGKDEYTNTETGEVTNARGIREFKDDSFTVADLQKKRVADYDFQGGSYGVTRKTAPAYVYTAPNGLEIVVPVGMSKAKQHLTLEKLVDYYNAVPTDIQRLGQKRIVLCDVYNPRDSFWRQKYKNFGHSFATGGDEITFWRCDDVIDDNWYQHTMGHEMGHWIDLGGSIVDSSGQVKQDQDRISESQKWLDAVASDLKTSGMRAVSTYGENSPHEDFADALDMYIRQHEQFVRDFPARAAVFREILQGKGK